MKNSQHSFYHSVQLYHKFDIFFIFSSNQNILYAHKKPLQAFFEQSYILESKLDTPFNFCQIVQNLYNYNVKIYKSYLILFLNIIPILKFNSQLTQQYIEKSHQILLMVVCYKFLYKQKKPDQSDLDRLSRRLSFKFPIVVRYSILFPILFGLVHTMLARNLKIFKKHMFTVPLYMLVLCQQQLYFLYRIQSGQKVQWDLKKAPQIKVNPEIQQKRLKLQHEMKQKAEKLKNQIKQPLNAEL